MINLLPKNQVEVIVRTGDESFESMIISADNADDMLEVLNLYYHGKTTDELCDEIYGAGFDHGYEVGTDGPQ